MLGPAPQEARTPPPPRQTPHVQPRVGKCSSLFPEYFNLRFANFFPLIRVRLKAFWRIGIKYVIEKFKILVIGDIFT